MLLLMLYLFTAFVVDVALGVDVADIVYVDVAAAAAAADDDDDVVVVMFFFLWTK